MVKGAVNGQQSGRRVVTLFIYLSMKQNASLCVTASFTANHSNCTVPSMCRYRWKRKTPAAECPTKINVIIQATVLSLVQSHFIKCAKSDRHTNASAQIYYKFNVK